MTKPKGPDVNALHRAREKEITLTVISDNPGNTDCQKCGERGLTFNCHLFREPPAGKIEQLCKSCAIERAGGEAKLHVRTGEYLARKWAQNARLECRLPRVRRHSSAPAAEVAP